MEKRKIYFIAFAVTAFVLVAWYWLTYRHFPFVQAPSETTQKAFTQAELESATVLPTDPGLAKKNSFTEAQLKEAATKQASAKK
jgi:hypothetical protein